MDRIHWTENNWVFFKTEAFLFCFKRLFIITLSICQSRISCLIHELPRNNEKRTTALVGAKLRI